VIVAVGALMIFTHDICMAHSVEVEGPAGSLDGATNHES
jgi:hypothetical protein